MITKKKPKKERKKEIIIIMKLITKSKLNCTLSFIS